MASETYTPPVSDLLAYGDCRETVGKKWPDYVEALNLTADHIPQLIQLANDRALWEVEDTDLAKGWAPIHAWRALGQLKAEAAIKPLINWFTEDNDWVSAEMPSVLSMIGPPAIPALTDYLQNPNNDSFPRIIAINCLQVIGEKHPDSQPACQTAVVQTLEQYADNDADLNGFLISTLVVFKATDTAPLIEQVFANGPVDEMAAGSWPQVQVGLGLKAESDFSAEELRPKLPTDLENLGQLMDEFLAMEKIQRPDPVGFGAARSDTPKKGKKKKKKKK